MKDATNNPTLTPLKITQVMHENSHDFLVALAKATGGAPTLEALSSILTEAGILLPKAANKRRWFGEVYGESFADYCSRRNIPSPKLMLGCRYIDNDYTIDTGESFLDYFKNHIELARKSDSHTHLREVLMGRSEIEGFVSLSKCATAATVGSTFQKAYGLGYIAAAQKLKLIEEKDIPNWLSTTTSKAFIKAYFAKDGSIKPEGWQKEFYRLAFKDIDTNTEFSNLLVNNSSEQRAKGKAEVLEFFS
ncbi:hypothetical protein VCHA53O466_50181 [Vibrio chagasii]|nr:hypothetical protein VCHA53O466_50181 [Vibrio chagasii]